MNINKFDSTIKLYTEVTELNKWLLVLDGDLITPFTPLMKAVYDRAIQTIHHRPYSRETQLANIELLLARGADVNIAYKINANSNAKFNDSMLMYALCSKDLELTKLLMKYGAQKLYKFDPEKMILIKEKFSKDETALYKLVKKRLRDDQISAIKDQMQIFLLGHQDQDSSHNKLPLEIVAQILTTGHSSGRAISSNQKRIDETKKMIEEHNKKQVLTDVEKNVNSGNTLMLTNY